MNVQDGINAAFSVLVSVFIVIVLVCLGWYLVWKLFLSRFKLVRELLGIAQSNEHTPVHSSSSSGLVGKEYSAHAAGGTVNSALAAEGKTRVRRVRRD
ncbi:small integral membrane protein 13 [Anopheles darlingi]|uniref:Protein with signal anchor n=1 Tax=Anopheles darlingi TaxID=43151 RepID=A0A2M4CGU0_ANODA|nr:small integral membrane protein 13 [Anopheles darlingi]